MLWGVENGVVNGYSATQFAPNETCKRSEIVTFLWRAMGKPEVTSDANPFKDVKTGKFYYNAMLWAVENGIAKGYTADMLAPYATITRGETVTFLYRNYAEEKEGSLVGTWKTPLNCEQLGITMGDEELDSYINYSKVNLTMTYKLYYDGTASMLTDNISFGDKYYQVVVAGIDAYYADVIKAEGLEGQITVEDIWAESDMTKADLRASIDEMVSAIPAYYECKYMVEDGKFYLTNTLDEEFDMTTYDLYELEGDTFTCFAGYTDGEYRDGAPFPLVFKKVK